MTNKATSVKGSYSVTVTNGTLSLKSANYKFAFYNGSIKIQ